MFSKSDKRFVDSHGNNDLPTMRHELEVSRKRAKLLRIEKLWPTESATIVAETSQRYWIPETIYLAASEKKKFPRQDFDTSSLDSAIFSSLRWRIGNLPASKPAALDVSLIESWNNVKLQIVPRLEKQSSRWICFLRDLKRFWTNSCNCLRRTWKSFWRRADVSPRVHVPNFNSSTNVGLILLRNFGKYWDYIYFFEIIYL